MPIVGSFAGASARAYGLGAGLILPGDFESIQTITAGSAVASIEFTSIPQSYSHLQIRGIGRSTIVGAADEIQIQFNSDTATNYSTHQFYGDGGTSASSAAATSSIMYGIYTTGASGLANNFGAGVFDILDYANTNKFKTIRIISGYDNNGSGYALMRSGNWRSTSAITSIKLFTASSNFAQYSSFALYGIKA
jgi:hypothetical protein